jgi:deoxyxylulose-5-phosphate synthase
MLPIQLENLVLLSRTCQLLYTLEEHSLSGGFGSHVLELINENDISIKVKRIGLDFTQGYCRENGDRSVLHKILGVSAELIADRIYKDLNDAKL